MADRSTVEKRKGLARTAIKKALKAGRPVGGVDGIRAILVEHVDEVGLPLDFFDAFTEKDVLELFVCTYDSHAAQSAKPDPSSHPTASAATGAKLHLSVPPNKNGLITPPTTEPSETQLEVEAESDGVEVEDIEAEEPTFEEDVGENIIALRS